MIKNRYNLEPFHNILLYTKQELALQNIKKQEIISLNKNLDKTHKNFSFISRGIYLSQILNWEKYFPLENFLIIKSEDLYDNPLQVMSEICDFLKIERIDNINYDVYKWKGDYKSSVNENIIYELKNFYAPYNDELEKHLNIKFNWD